MIPSFPEIQLPGKPGPLSPELYLLFGGKNAVPVKVPLSPVGYRGTYKIEFNGWPNREEWSQIFEFFPFKDETRFAVYFSKLAAELENSGYGYEITQRNKNLDEVLMGAGYSPGKKEELLELASCEEPFLRLRADKNIPVKIIRLLRINKEAGLSLAALVSESILKPNDVRKILTLWVDLKAEAQKEFEAKLIKKISETNDAGELADALYKDAWSLRYPEYEAHMRQIRERIKDLDKIIQIDFDPLLESSYFSIVGKIRSQRQLDEFLEALSNDSNKRILSELLSRLLDNG